MIFHIWAKAENASAILVTRSNDFPLSIRSRKLQLHPKQSSRDGRWLLKRPLASGPFLAKAGFTMPGHIDWKLERENEVIGRDVWEAGHGPLLL
jgi:hypothetical protein